MLEFGIIRRIEERYVKDIWKVHMNFISWFFDLHTWFSEIKRHSKHNKSDSSQNISSAHPESVSDLDTGPLSGISPFSNEATNWNWSWQALDILQVLFRFIHRGWIKQLLSRNSKLSFHFCFKKKVSNYSNTNWLKLGNYCFMTFWIRFIYYLLAEPSPSKYESRWRP